MQAGREIKFRGMDLDGQWHYGNLAVLVENVRHLKQGHYISNGVGLPFAYQVRPETVGQFTGLCDKNGKEIYEGDVGESEGVVYHVLWVDHCAKYGVKVIKADHVLIRGMTFPLQQYINPETTECNFEIIGNIYENPELLSAA